MRGVGEQDTVGPQDLVGAQALRVRDAHVSQVAERLLHDLLRLGQHHEHLAVQLERVEEIHGVAGLRLVERDVVHDRELAALQRVGERRAQRAARIFLFTRISWECGCGPCATPPPTHWGERIEPWRARPVPFWRHGFLPPPETSPRVFVECVPARIPARPAMTT